jgi:hypothetical protein
MMKMDNRKLLFSIITVSIALACLSAAAFAASAVNPEISAQAAKYEPYPAVPGQYFDLWINIENSGLGPANQFTFMIEPKYPFSLDSGENATRYFGSIDASNNALVKYRIRTASDAVEGYNSLQYSYKVGSDGYWITNNLSIYVQNPYAIIAIINVTTTPGQISPGKASELDIGLKNMAGTSLKDVTVKLDLSAVSFYPTGTATEQKSYLMQAGESKTFSFDLMAGPSVDAGVYKIPMNISYYDMAGASYSKIDYATVIVGDTPDLVTGIEKTTLLAAGENGIVTLKIINKGLTGIKLLSVNLQNSDSYVIVSPSSQLYVGKLDSDGYETVEYSLYVKPGVNGIVMLPLTLEYMDDNNNHFIETREIALKIYAPDELSTYGLRISGGISLTVIILVLLIVGYIVYRKFFRKSNKR